MASRIFLDNAATTPIDPLVMEAMLPYFTEFYGNPSSIHAHGRKVKSALETARKTIAGLLNTSPAEIFFTSGGTEADNTAICSSIDTFGLKHAVTSKLEHHAVLHTLEHLQKTGKIELSFVDIDTDGKVSLDSLAAILASKPRSLVSLMHGNNEIANLLNLKEAGEICKKYDAIFHSDTVQTMGHYVHDLQTLPVDFIVGSAHKFHGPKGVGFLYINAGSKISPFIHGGAQERNMRGGTENIYGIVGLAKALQLAYEGMESHENHIKALKQRMILGLQERVPGVAFNGQSSDVQNSLYTVLNVSFPAHPNNEMLLFNLDIDGISCSGGSACSSGTDIGSHVLGAIGTDPEKANVRFSFSKYTTEAEIDRTLEVLSSVFQSKEMV